MPSPGDVDLRKLRLARPPEAALFHTSYPQRQWLALFNPTGAGNARFSPLYVGGATVPTMYGAATQTVALLESSFHGVHQAGTKVVSEALDLDRLPQDPGAWLAGSPHFDDLTSGYGRSLAELIAEQLGAVIVAN